VFTWRRAFRSSMRGVTSVDSPTRCAVPVRRSCSRVADGRLPGWHHSRLRRRSRLAHSGPLRVCEVASSCCALPTSSCKPFESCAASSPSASSVAARVWSALVAVVLETGAVFDTAPWSSI